MTWELARQAYVGRAQTGYSRAGARLENRLRETGPRGETGDLVRKTRVTPRGPLRLQTLVDTPYASYMREGTRPHEIQPRRKKVLRFIIDGVVIFARRVQHPGTKPNNWYDQALDEFPRMIQDELRAIR